MAKKTSKLAPLPKGSAARAKAAAAKKVSLKKIVAEIDKALGQIDTPQARAGDGTQAQARAKLALRAARDAVHSICMPGFNIPD